jgi:multidrug efflux pump subunit AcrA (membrane-fusion protein)
VHKDQEIVIEPADGGKPILGKVSFISPVVDPTTRTIKIRALMDNPGSQLRADMYVKGSLTLSRRNGLIVPGSALVRLRDSNFCFMKVGSDVFKKVSLEIAKEQNGIALVTKGVEAGNEVVSEGGLLLDAALSTAEKQ